MRKASAIMVILIIISSILSLYTIKAHIVAQRIIDDPGSGDFAWQTTSSATFFPWPQEPNGLEAQMIAPLVGINSFIYRYLIKSWVLVGLSILAWICTGLFIFRLARRKWGLRDFN